MTDEPHPPYPEHVCGRCGAVIGVENETGCLLLPDGTIITALSMVHRCGAPFHFNRPTALLARLIARQLEQPPKFIG